MLPCSLENNKFVLLVSGHIGHERLSYGWAKDGTDWWARERRKCHQVGRGGQTYPTGGSTEVTHGRTANEAVGGTSGTTGAREDGGECILVTNVLHFCSHDLVSLLKTVAVFREFCFCWINISATICWMVSSNMNRILAQTNHVTVTN